MNALDKNKKKCTAWCEDCEEVFDNIIDSEIHKDFKKHRIKLIEFWTISKR
ncbi:MAG: hypothetical protein MRJ93_12680 [Nitrososphaeraceae archaeon]|nr:hypothetical protein [Nitrososphaeraceae archaeon]